MPEENDPEIEQGMLDLLTNTKGHTFEWFGLARIPICVTCGRYGSYDYEGYREAGSPPNYEGPFWADTFDESRCPMEWEFKAFLPEYNKWKKNKKKTTSK